jgi:hypothetical protein
MKQLNAAEEERMGYMATATTPESAVRAKTGRLYFWLGLAAPFIGIGIYAGQLALGVLKLPWYMPVLGTIGLALLVWAVVQKRSAWRIGTLVLVALLASLQWFMAVGLRLPAYTGPVAAGKPFPAFATVFADGKPFTPDSFQGKDTALVFFRGHW